MWVEFNLVGHNFHLRRKSFGIKGIQKQLHVFHLAFRNCFEFNRISLKKQSPTGQWSFSSPSKNTPYPPPLTLLLSKFKSIRKAFSLTSRLCLENWLVSHTHFSARRQCWYRSTVFLVCCSKYVQHAALLYQVNMCTGEDEAWAHRKQSNGNQKDFLFQSSPIFICRGYPIISLITSHTSESIPELFCCTFLYLFYLDDKYLL